MSGSVWVWHALSAKPGNAATGAPAARMHSCEGTITCIAWQPRPQAAVQQQPHAVCVVTSTRGHATLLDLSACLHATAACRSRPSRTTSSPTAASTAASAASATSPPATVKALARRLLTWRVAPASETKRVRWPVWSAAWSPQGCFIATASEDGITRVWRVQKKSATAVAVAPAGTVTGHVMAVTGVDWATMKRPTVAGAGGGGGGVAAGSHSILVSSSDDRSLRVYRLRGPETASATPGLYITTVVLLVYGIT